MKRFAVMLSLCLAACSESSAIETAIREGLIDPESARISGITEYSYDGKQMACAMVNAKNRMGGYTGEQIMIAMKGEQGNWLAAPIGDVAEGYDCAFFIANVVERSD